jgi:copper(I)-binding protein
MRSWLIAMLTLVSAVALADPAGIRIDHVWSRAMPAGATGVVYLTVTNQGAPDALTGVATPVAASAGLHETIDDHGVMKMRPVASLAVTSDKPVMLTPGGYHIMLTGLKQALVAGTSFPLTLTFAKAGRITVTARVQAMGAAGPAPHQRGMGQTDMHGTPTHGSGSK